MTPRAASKPGGLVATCVLVALTASAQREALSLRKSTQDAMRQHLSETKAPVSQWMNFQESEDATLQACSTWTNWAKAFRAKVATPSAAISIASGAPADHSTPEGAYVATLRYWLGHDFRSWARTADSGAQKYIAELEAQQQGMLHSNLTDVVILMTSHKTFWGTNYVAVFGCRQQPQTLTNGIAVLSCLAFRQVGQTYQYTRDTVMSRMMNSPEDVDEFVSNWPESSATQAARRCLIEDLSKPQGR